MNHLATLRKVLGAAGIALLAGALAYAPVAAFGGDMTIVSKAGIAGAILVLIAWLLPGRSSAEHPTPSDPGSGTGPPRERT